MGDDMALEVAGSNLPVQGGGLELATTGAAAAEQHKIQAALVVAKKFPRDEMGSYQAIIKATKRPTFAEDTMYRFPRSGSDIEGPSVYLAREMARAWGNIRYGLAVLRDDAESRLIRGWAWDLQTNSYVEADDDFAKLVFRKKGGWIKPDERDLRELTNRRGAILIRNCLLQLLPSDFIVDACESAKQTLIAGAKADPDATLKKLTTAFSSLGVTTTMLGEWLAVRREVEKANITDATAEDIVELRQIYKSICDGNSKIGEYFGEHPTAPPTNGAPTADAAQIKTKPKAKKDEPPDADQPPPPTDDPGPGKSKGELPY